MGVISSFFILIIAALSKVNVSKLEVEVVKAFKQ